MLNGFELITADLSEYEKDTLLPIFISQLSKAIGKHSAVTSGRMLLWFKKRNFIVSGPRIRKIINHIRIHDLIPGLIATSEGYYISNDPGEVKNYIESLEGRIKAISAVKASMQQHFKTITLRSQPTFF